MNETRRPPQLGTDNLSLPWSEGERPHLQAHFVARLRRLLQLRRAHLGELNQEGAWLLDKSIFATYCDCVEVGAGLAAQDVLRSLSSSREPDAALARPSRRQH